MSILHQGAIKEIAAEIAKGNTCYIHKSSRKITSIDISSEDTKVIAAQEKAIAAIELKMENYLKIEKLSTKDELEIMSHFLEEEVRDKSLRKELLNALNRKNPTRNFNQVIKSDMELKQRWRLFWPKEYQRWVSNFIIDAYNY